MYIDLFVGYIEIFSGYNFESLTDNKYNNNYNIISGVYQVWNQGVMDPGQKNLIF